MKILQHTDSWMTWKNKHFTYCYLRTPRDIHGDWGKPPYPPLPKCTAVALKNTFCNNSFGETKVVVNLKSCDSQIYEYNNKSRSCSLFPDGFDHDCIALSDPLVKGLSHEFEMAQSSMEKNHWGFSELSFVSSVLKLMKQICRPSRKRDRNCKFMQGQLVGRVQMALKTLWKILEMSWTHSEQR
jgi:hypothetical protein